MTHLNDEIVRRLEIANTIWSGMTSSDDEGRGESLAAAAREPR
jgi:hypothetical protein